MDNGPAEKTFKNSSGAAGPARPEEGAGGSAEAVWRPHVELRDLRWAVIASQHRSLRRAAATLNIRQSTLKRHPVRHLDRHQALCTHNGGCANHKRAEARQQSAPPCQGHQLPFQCRRRQPPRGRDPRGSVVSFCEKFLSNL
jgi:hypothetical protein